jgi:tRNA A37 threonylcarbamoyladenosine synthetase subunit TsaC/SUA5/YrdC
MSSASAGSITSPSANSLDQQVTSAAAEEHCGAKLTAYLAGEEGRGSIHGDARSTVFRLDTVEARVHCRCRDGGGLLAACSGRIGV